MPEDEEKPSEQAGNIRKITQYPPSKNQQKATENTRPSTPPTEVKPP